MRGYGILLENMMRMRTRMRGYEKSQLKKYMTQNPHMRTFSFDETLAFFPLSARSPMIWSNVHSLCTGELQAWHSRACSQREVMAFAAEITAKRIFCI